MGLTALLPGCQQRPAVAPVEGRVEFDGKPLTFGAVIFQPAAGGQPARGEILPDGSFQLSTYAKGDGARVCKHRVRVLCFESQDPANADKHYGDSAGRLLIPRKYANAATSGFVVDVASTDNEPVVLELVSKPGR